MLSRCTSAASLPLLLQRCSSLHHLDPFFAAAIKTNAHHQSFFAAQFVACCCRLGHMDYARQVFDERPDPTPFLCDAIIRGLMLWVSPSEALSFYIARIRSLSRVVPTSYTYLSLVQACSRERAERLGEAVQGDARKMGFGSQLYVQTALIDFYGSFGRVGDARKVFDEIRERDFFSWTAMISVYSHSGSMDSALELLEVMPERITASWNALITGFARIGDVDSAASIFDAMPVKNLVSWTSMISCYSRNTRYKEAVDIFMAMRRLGIEPDEVTLAAVVSSCVHLGAILVGEDIHRYLIQKQFNLNVYIGSSLIDMYAKCGDLRRSLMVFFKLKRRNLFCWNAVIDGLAVHGRGRDALRMYAMMEMDGSVIPNGVTFVSLLTACNHARLVEEGREIFYKMARDYGITPEIEHYGCVVDLMGRAGFLTEALDLIGSMTVEPNSVIWGSILSGSKVHNNLEIGQVALQKLMALEQDNVGYHALVVNMYAEENMWWDVACIRANIKDRGMPKYNPGCSWIEVDGEVHEFKTCDGSHPSSDDIFQVLEELHRQLKLKEVFLF